jgi:hypothetical protein
MLLSLWGGSNVFSTSTELKYIYFSTLSWNTLCLRDVSRLQDRTFSFGFGQTQLQIHAWSSVWFDSLYICTAWRKAATSHRLIVLATHSRLEWQDSMRGGTLVIPNWIFSAHAVAGRWKETLNFANYSLALAFRSTNHTSFHYNFHVFEKFPLIYAIPLNKKSWIYAIIIFRCLRNFIKKPKLKTCHYTSIYAIFFT